MSDPGQKKVSGSHHEEGGAIIFDKAKSDDEIARQRREDEQHEFARQQVKTNKRLAWFTGFLVVGSFVGTGISIWQARISQTAANAAKSAAETADSTLKRGERPWVNAESFVPTALNLPPDKKFDIQGELVIKNSGPSVATDGVMMMVAVPNSSDYLMKNPDIACQVTDQQIHVSEQSAAKSGDSQRGFVLAPGQEARLRIGMGDFSGGLIEAQIARAVQITKALPRAFQSQNPRDGQFFLLGCARYKDQFRTAHTTRFCFIYLNDKMSPSGFYSCANGTSD